MYERQLTSVDHLLIIADSALRTVFGRPPQGRPNPGMEHTQLPETESERDLSSRLMRVNHSGEVCAQALYQGQGLTARETKVRKAMEQASNEENDHLAWCAQRLDQLGTHKSRLNPVWYAGSFAIGAVSGLLGDRWSLGFLAETERQVVKHLENHLERLPESDRTSRAIIEQMRDDEAKHATTALRHGGRELPQPVKRLMAVTAKVMTITAARL